VDEEQRNDYRGALSRAYDMLARRPHTVQEVRRKLLKDRFAPETVEQVIEELEQRRFVNDASLAEDSAQSLARQRGWGSHKIRQWLQQRGIDQGTVEGAMQGLDPEGEASRARDLASAQRARGKRPEQVFRFLVSRGFRTDVARDAALAHDDPAADD